MLTDNTPHPADSKQARDLLGVLQEAKQEIDPRLAEMARYGGGGGGGRYGGYRGRGGGGGGRHGGEFALFLHFLTPCFSPFLYYFTYLLPVVARHTNLVSTNRWRWRCELSPHGWQPPLVGLWFVPPAQATR